MSKVKSPGEKKKLSLALDRRNVYGENAKASRKGIPRGKRQAHKDERHAVSQILASVPEQPADDDAVAAEVAADTAARVLRLKRFKKESDWPLGYVLTFTRKKRQVEGPVIEAVVRGNRWRVLKRHGRS